MPGIRTSHVDAPGRSARVQAALSPEHDVRQLNACRMRIDIGADWFFLHGRRGRHWLAGGGESGQRVCLPHCWNERDTFRDGVLYRRGYGSYRREVALPPPVVGAAADHEWSLVTGGFYGTGDVWLDGRRAARVDGQYLGFRLPLGRADRTPARCVVGIRLTNRCARHVLPGIDTPDFLLYGGLSAHVRLECAPRLRLDREAIRIATTSTPQTADVELRFDVVNRYAEAKECDVAWEVYDADGNVFKAPVTRLSPAPGGVASGAVRISVPAPRRWSPAEPCMYRAEGRLLEQGRDIDAAAQSFGIREAEFRPGQGFFLNETRLVLRGCNRHESMPGFGRALPAGQHREDAALIKAAGLNLVRLSHYPQDPAFLRACDELGLLVYAEIATWKRMRRGRWLKAACRQMRDMIRRDRNHPCIILWGMGNEARSRHVYRRLRAVAGVHDPTRPVIYAENHISRARRKGTVGIPDVWGVNYEWDAVPAGRLASRLASVLVSECANCPHARRGDPAAELDQVRVVRAAVARAVSEPYVAGFALWSFNDYATVRKKRYFRHCGIVDAWRVPKMTWHMLRALYTEEPFIHVHGDWSVHAPAGRRRIDVFTNCAEVRLSVGGRKVAVLRERPHAFVEIDFEAAELRADGAGGVSAVLCPVGPALAYRVAALPGDRDAARRETVCLDILVVDEAGNPVVSWGGAARIRVDGPAAARAYRPDDGIDIAGGRGRAFVSGTGEPGRASITVSGASLRDAAAEIRFV